MNVMMRSESLPIDAHNYRLRELYARLKGQIIRQDDAGYDQTRELAISNWNREPALIVRAAGPEDVAAAIEYARDAGLVLAIRGGGHSVCGHGTAAGGLVIDLRDLKTLEIGEDKSSVWAGAGLTAGEVTVALEEHQLAVGFGDAATVGISGLTLGGGIGYLVRKAWPYHRCSLGSRNSDG